VIAAEHLHPFPVQTLGHKGLFLDRLDSESNAPSSSGDSAHRLVPFAHSIYHNRNRVYSPSLGRFLQQDPNQTAMVVNSALAMHGLPLAADPGAFDLEGVYGDGFSLHQYVGSNPIANSDPTGLFIGGIGPTDTLMMGFEIGRVAFNLIDAYANDLNAYSIWANDWSLDDDLFSQVPETSADVWGFGGGEYAMASGRAKGIKAAANLANAAGRVRSGSKFDSYYKARYAIKQAGAKLEAHHIVEVRVLKALGMKTNGPAIALTRAEHLVLTNKLRKHLPYSKPGGTKLSPKDKQKIIDSYKKAYEEYPDLLNTALKVLR
jgi:uncharacterized protein RhaS with RHS repeats